MNNLADNLSVFTISEIKSLPKESPLRALLDDEKQRELLYECMMSHVLAIPFNSEIAPSDTCRSRLAKIEFVQDFQRVFIPKQKALRPIENDPDTPT